MARYRTIKPEFFTSVQVADCSTTSRLLFVGLWCFCDDRGVHTANVKRVKMEVFPADPLTVEDVTKCIEELISAGLLYEFSSQGQVYWWVTGWEKHQRIEKKTFQFPGPFADGSTPTRRPLDDASPLSRVELSRVEENGKEELGARPSKDPKKPRVKRDYSTEFADWWLAYPKKSAKLDAAKAYPKAVERIASENGGDLPAAAAVLLAATVAFSKTADLREGGRFCPHPATWLNRGQYADEPPPAESRAYDPETDGPWNPRTGIG